MQMRIENSPTAYVELEFPIVVPLTIDEDDTISLGSDVTLHKISQEIIDYLNVINKPSINGVTLLGDRSLAELGVPTRTSELINDSNFISDINLIFDCGDSTHVIYEE